MKIFPDVSPDAITDAYTGVFTDAASAKLIQNLYWCSANITPALRDDIVGAIISSPRKTLR